MSRRAQLTKDYVIAVQAPAERISATCFATESAFAAHLRELRRSTAHAFDRLVLISPQFDSTASAATGKLERIDASENIVYAPSHRLSDSTFAFWLRHAWRLWSQVGPAGIVHAGISTDIWRPLMFVVTVMGVLRRKRTVFVVDTDFRDIAHRMHTLGIWSRKSYLLCRWIYDPLRIAQLKFGCRFCSLTLLKSPRLVSEYGKGRPSVRSFFDTAHAAGDVLSASGLSERLSRLQTRDTPLRMCYFGRFMEYKGLPNTIRAVHAASRLSGRNFELHLIGDGPVKPELIALVEQLGMTGNVRLHPPVPYGPELFALLRGMDLQLATQLNEDTPRAAFDAMAAGIPIAAFDLAYYRDLASESGAVITTPWMEIDALAKAIVDLDADRARLARMSSLGVEFARANTQEIWIDRRLAWTLEQVEAG